VVRPPGYDTAHGEGPLCLCRTEPECTIPMQATRRAREFQCSGCKGWRPYTRFAVRALGMPGREEREAHCGCKDKGKDKVKPKQGRAATGGQKGEGGVSKTKAKTRAAEAAQAAADKIIRALGMQCLRQLVAAGQIKRDWAQAPLAPLGQQRQPAPAVSAGAAGAGPSGVRPAPSPAPLPVPQPPPDPLPTLSTLPTLQQQAQLLQVAAGMHVQQAGLPMPQLSGSLEGFLQQLDQVMPLLVTNDLMVQCASCCTWPGSRPPRPACRVLSMHVPERSACTVTSWQLHAVVSSP
jgi:hypothetical protein